MDGIGSFGSSGIQLPTKLHDSPQLPSTPAGDAVFDASQYAFFGNDFVEDVELGGLEDDMPSMASEEKDFLYDKEDVPFLIS